MTSGVRHDYLRRVYDRHIQPEAWLFSSEETAVAYARRVARDWLEEQDQAHRPKEWLYLATHVYEDDAVWMIAKTVDDPECRL